tara:strand:+ start:77 stop:556 length:480 start_codon:yes stop_codon:yes gene_type:complete
MKRNNVKNNTVDGCTVTGAYVGASTTVLMTAGAIVSSPNVVVIGDGGAAIFTPVAVVGGVLGGLTGHVVGTGVGTALQAFANTEPAKDYAASRGRRDTYQVGDFTKGFVKNYRFGDITRNLLGYPRKNGVESSSNIPMGIKIEERNLDEDVEFASRVEL